MKRASFTNSNVKAKPSADKVRDTFEIFGIKKPITVSDSDMVGQPVFYDRKLVGTIMDQWDGRSLVVVNQNALFVIEGYKTGQIRGKDLKIHLRG